MLDAALVRINQGYQAECMVALEAERPEMLERIQDHQDAADNAVLACDHVSARAAIQRLEEAWIEAEVWYRARCTEDEAA